MVEETHLEVAFRSMEGIDYFLSIIVPLERSDEIVKLLSMLS